MSDKNTFFKQKSTLNINGKLLDLTVPKVMGILNITPDSFYDGGVHNNIDQALRHTEKHLSEGAAIIDIGAYSSRPSAADISVKDEIDRLRPVLQAIAKRFPEAILSIDTFRSEVATAAVNEGAHIINDISGGSLDERMFETIAELKVPYILMHMRGTPKTMQKLTSYNNMVQEILEYFISRISDLRSLGVKDIIIDPGYGFAKTTEQNYELLSRSDQFKILELPVLTAVSRKSMIYKPLEISADEALNGTTALHTIALLKGSSILRAHDVKQAVEAIKIVSMLPSY
ncbi:dihydropteroate synthase [Pedobacter sp. HMF7647]|uniref:Dihydropteroate synthase n=1 Tax=Hufsiella arboris TaxID=2695275 RepID=A0A7K1Y5G2_9SPHI|nr:dihydropteroate synthase [Hufsiella arboris]MXV49349.1 dihydropteroate synthase [Hufsiella arboris]